MLIMSYELKHSCELINNFRGINTIKCAHVCARFVMQIDWLVQHEKSILTKFYVVLNENSFICKNTASKSFCKIFRTFLI